MTDAAASITFTDSALANILGKSVPKSMKYEEAKTEYRRGLRKEGMLLSNGDTLPAWAVGTFIGDLGEFAFKGCCYRYVGREVVNVNTEVLEQGDGGLDFAELSVQVKCREGKFPTSLYRVTDDDGITLPFIADYYVFTEWDGERTVYLLGWETREVMEQLPVVPARAKGGLHRNVEVPDSTLRPMSELLEILKAKHNW